MNCIYDNPGSKLISRQQRNSRQFGVQCSTSGCQDKKVGDAPIDPILRKRFREAKATIKCVAGNSTKNATHEALKIWHAIEIFVRSRQPCRWLQNQ